MRIIIALDIIGGKCVRLTKGDFATSKIYSENPLEIARQVVDHGIKYIHLVDLDGTREKRIVNHGILESIAGLYGLEVDFGGGIRSEEDLRIAFGSGAKQVTCGSIAVTDPDRVSSWIREWGPDRIILGADSLKRKIATEGWAEDSGSDIIQFITAYRSRGIKYAICTDIEKDGMLQGPSEDLYRELIASVPGINLIASGGITTIGQIMRLSKSGCEWAIIGKDLYEGLLNLKELSTLC